MTYWRETWALALLRLSPGRPEAPGVTSNPSLSATVALRQRPLPPIVNGVIGQGILEEQSRSRSYNSSKKVMHPPCADMHAKTRLQKEKKTKTKAMALSVFLLMFWLVLLPLKEFNSRNKMLNFVQFMLKCLMSSTTRKEHKLTCVCTFHTACKILMQQLW